MYLKGNGRMKTVYKIIIGAASAAALAGVAFAAYKGLQYLKQAKNNAENEACKDCPEGSPDSSSENGVYVDADYLSLEKEDDECDGNCCCCPAAGETSAEEDSGDTEQPENLSE